MAKRIDQMTADELAAYVATLAAQAQRIEERRQAALDALLAADPDAWLTALLWTDS